MGELLLAAVEKYLASHPEVVEKLVEKGVEFLLSKIASK